MCITIGQSAGDGACYLINLEKELSRTDSDDLQYFTGHQSRFVFSASVIANRLPSEARVLDIGSHSLHMSAIISAMGFEVVGIDVSYFSEKPYVAERARLHGIRNFACDDLASGNFLPGFDGSFDCIIFNEALEHITFNPIKFWDRVSALLKPEGFVYLTTPNSLTLPKIISGLFKLIFLRGYGIGVDSILNIITYGHHWKEYSKPEVERYFKLIGARQVTVRRFNLEYEYYSTRKPGLKGYVWWAVKWLSRTIPFFNENLECIIKFY